MDRIVVTTNGTYHVVIYDTCILLRSTKSWWRP